MKKHFRTLAALGVAAALALSLGAASAEEILLYDEDTGIYILYDDEEDRYYYWDEDAAAYIPLDPEEAGNAQAPDEECEDITSRILIQGNSQEEIRAKFIGLGLNTEWKKAEYAVQPSTKKPYSAGRLSDESLQQGLNMLNFIRYTAGLPDNVVLDEEYINYAQCASVVNAANGVLSHYPDRPSGMSDKMYNDARQGASSSNLGMGYGSLAQSLAYGYMEDSDSGNIDRVGHRRWLLDPSLKKTGFGFAGEFTATYVSGDEFDFGRSFSGEYVAWPPANMPMELYHSYSGRYAFSVSFSNEYDRNSLYDAVVTVKSQKTGKSWTISRGGGGGTYFSVNNDNYGMSGCLIFDTGVMFESGDKVSVSVKGIRKNGKDASISYDVNFFTMTPSVKDCEISQIKPQIYTGKALKPKPVVKYKGKKLTEGTDYTLEYNNNTSMGTGTVTIKGKGSYSGSTEATFSIKPKKQEIKAMTGGKNYFTLKWTKQSGMDFYMIQYSTNSSMKNAKTVYAYGTDASRTVSGLKSGRKYYVRVCNYAYSRTAADGYITGAWSKVKAVTVK